MQRNDHYSSSLRIGNRISSRSNLSNTQFDYYFVGLFQANVIENMDADSDFVQLIVAAVVTQLAYETNYLNIAHHDNGYSY